MTHLVGVVVLMVSSHRQAHSRPSAGPQNTGVVPPGQTKTPWDRNTFRDSWMGTGNNVGAQDALLKQYGLNISGNGTVTLPSGEQMDIRRGARAGDNTAQWMGVGGGGASYGTGNDPRIAGGGPNMPPGPPGMQHDPKWDALYDQLLEQVEAEPHS
jgi:hypothetical protein